MKVVFDIRSGRLSIEGDGPDLLKVLEAAKTLAPSISQILITTVQEPREDGPVAEAASSSTGNASQTGAKTLRQFARSMTLNNAAERIAAIAYYVNKIEGRQSFSPKEMDGWFTMCGYQKPGQMSVALYDTKRKYGYADNAGHGAWRISNQGENLIIAKIEDHTA
jgi:hypothetical protein